MAITWANILEWETRPLDEIARELLEASQGLRKAYEKGEDDLKAVQSEGEAVTAMRATTITNLASLERALTNVNGALMAIEGARDGVATVMSNINTLQAYASTNNCTILNDGSVVGEGSRTQRGGKSPARFNIEQGIKDIIEQADQVDTELYHALQDINNDSYTDGDWAENKVIGVPDLPQPNWSPSQNAAWWKSLTYEQQQFLIHHRPDDIRHLDGLPALARGLANHFALEGYVDANGDRQKGALADAKKAVDDANDKYQAALKKSTNKELNPALAKNDYIDPEVATAKRELDLALEKYEDLKAIKRETDNDVRMSNGLAPAYLLDFNYDDKYHRTTAIVSAGNPDTATHVSTLVPGIGTNVRGDLDYYMDFNDRLRKQTAHAGVNPNNVATISYLGYVAPKNDAEHLYQAAIIGYADRAAPKLARFEEGLRANAKVNNHNFLNTLLAHSYGSTTSGKSMTLVAPGTVDRFVMCGSPGAGADTIDAYNVSREHVYVSSIPTSDAVQDLNTFTPSGFGSDPRYLDGITHLSGDVTDSENYVPPRVPPIDDNPLIHQAYRFVHALDHHMAYFDENTRTSQDFANIVAGGNPTTDEEWAAIKAARAKENNGH